MKSYKAAPTNVKKNHVAGSFKHNSKNKKGTGGTPNKDVKEKLAKKDQLHVKLRKISGAMFARHSTLNGDVSMRAQKNA